MVVISDAKERTYIEHKPFESQNQEYWTPEKIKNQYYRYIILSPTLFDKCKDYAQKFVEVKQETLEPLTFTYLIMNNGKEKVNIFNITGSNINLLSSRKREFNAFNTNLTNSDFKKLYFDQDYINTLITDTNKNITKMLSSLIPLFSEKEFTDKYFNFIPIGQPQMSKKRTQPDIIEQHELEAQRVQEQAQRLR